MNQFMWDHGKIIKDKEMELYTIKMKDVFKENGMQTKLKDLGDCIILTETFIKELIKIVNLMGVVNIFVKAQVISLLGCILMISMKDLERSTGKMVLNLKDYSKMDLKMDLENLNGRMAIVILEILLIIKDRDMENINGLHKLLQEMKSLIQKV